MSDSSKPRMTYRDMMQYLIEMAEAGCPQLDDNVTVYDMNTGEYYPAELLQFDGEDDIIDKDSLFIAAYDWSDELVTDEDEDDET